MGHSRKTIKELFRQIQHGQAAAFDRVYLMHFDNLKRFALQYVKKETAAEEIVSERFVQLWLRRAKLADIENPVFYLYRAVKNACLTLLEREGRYAQVPIEAMQVNAPQAMDTDDPEKMLEYKELIAYLDAAIDRMPDQRRTIFRMVKEDRLTCREVADLLGLSVRTVENQVYLAVKRLSEEVDRYFNAGNAQHGETRRMFLLPMVIS
ncbi:RNA polymerase sigma-70 factor [Parapedobacter sp.]